MNAYDFLNAMFDGADGNIVIWQKGGGARAFGNVPDGRRAAAKYATSAGQGRDVYFCCGLQGEPPKGGDSRGTAETVSAIGGFWLDLDLAGDAHKAGNLPDEATARRLLLHAAKRPSIIIDSGHGLHCYWLFDKPWNFADDADRQRAADMSKRFQVGIRAVFENQGFKLDNTADLARVLRLPGTLNHKGPEPRPVEVVHPADGGEPKRCSLDDLVDLVADTPPAKAAPAETTPAKADTTDAERRCLAYLEKCPEAVSGKGGHDATLRAACECFRFGLDDAAALRVMNTFNSTKAAPPWTAREIEHKLNSARAKVRQAGEIGCRLDEKTTGDKTGKGGDGEKKSVADKLVEIALRDAELAHDSGNTAWGRVRANDHTETHPVASKGFKLWLGERYYRETGKSPYSEAVRTAVDMATAKAIHDGPAVASACRVAEHAGKVYLDLADDGWQVVEVDADGWRIVQGCPVWFRRSNGMLPLPTPEPGGDLGKLRDFINVASDDDFAMVVSWLFGAMNPNIPFPILNMTGEQGTGKSNAQRMLRALIDPNLSPLRTAPKEPRDLLITATNSWILGYDNLSGLPGWLSDAFCRLSTGGGFSTRELYSDCDEVIFDARRPLLINGVSHVANRSDLLDRCINITLDYIPASRREPEAELWADFNAARPGLLGALLDVVSAGLANRESTTIGPEDMPRMADFAVWAVACERAAPWPGGTFLDAYNDNREQANAEAVESHPVGLALVKLMDGRDRWEGAAGELLADLEQVAGERTCKRRDWPTSSRKLRNVLDRLAPNLREAEKLELGRPDGGRGRKGRTFVIERTDSQPYISGLRESATSHDLDSGRPATRPQKALLAESA